ncbi:AraC family transcriptional regulator [Microbacterium sp. DT81.1]|uniref:AraC family transcriptional regulator n=1 Tax=Microbacterium sp. DT81.1 TaxID=3393413 RepID=UPI003CFA28A0
MANPRGIPDSAVPLAHALHMLRLTGVLYCRADAGAPWGVDFPQLESHMSVPVVLSGRCVLEVAGQRHMLEAGSAALIPRGTPHVLASAEGVRAEPLFDLPFEQVGERFERMRIGGEGPRTQIAYAALCADDALTQRLAAELPTVIVVDGADDEEFGSFRSVLRLMAREAATDQLGGDTVLARLADVLVVQLLRRWLSGADAPATGWLAALSDPHVGRALSRMHADPAREWTLVALAREARMSRSTFVDRFTSLIGEPPMRYLAGWRLQQAHAELTRTDAPIGQVAGRVGYSSEAAFSRAFKRRHGTTPGEARRAMRVGNARQPAAGA